MMAGFIGLTLVMAGCGYDKPNSANDANSGNGSGYITAANVEARVTTASGDLTQALTTFRAQLGDQLGRGSGHAHQSEQLPRRPVQSRGASWSGVHD